MTAGITTLGRIGFIIGLVITVITFFAGFGLMFYGGYDAWVKVLLMLVPIGFFILFVGLATVILFEPRDKE